MPKPIRTGENPIERAQSDWENHDAQFMFAGELLAEHALIHKSGLYMSFFIDPDFAEQYNAEVQRLIETNGQPEWCPGRRLPNQDEARTTLDSGIPFSDYKERSPNEGRLVRSVANRWTKYEVSPTFFSRNDEKKLAFLGGPTPNGYRIDVLDLDKRVFMHTYET